MLKSLTVEQAIHVSQVAQSAVRSRHVRELADALGELDDQARCELMALYWMGRDWEGTFEEAVVSARELDRKTAISVFSDKALRFSEFVAKGLELIAASNRR